MTEGLPFAKPSKTRKAEKQEEKEAQNRVIAKVRGDVFARDRHECRNPLCPTKKDKWTYSPVDRRLTMDELTPRSATGGLPPEQRFNTTICLALCWLCHRKRQNDLGGRRLTITVLRHDLGTSGPMLFEWDDSPGTPFSGQVRIG